MVVVGDGDDGRSTLQHPPRQCALLTQTAEDLASLHFTSTLLELANLCSVISRIGKPNVRRRKRYS